MADWTQTDIIEYAVKFPNGKVPSNVKIDGFSDYLPVKSFTKPGHEDKPGAMQRKGQGLVPVQQQIPVQIEVDPEYIYSYNHLLGAGYQDEEIKLVVLGRDDKDKHTEAWDSEIEGFVLSGNGHAGYLTITGYKKYKSQSYGEGPTLTEGYDFDKQKRID